MNLHSEIKYNPVTEGKNASFHCSTNFTKGITYAWYINQHKQDGQKGKMFTIYDINRNQNGSIVTCELLINNTSVENATKDIDVYCKFTSLRRICTIILE